MSSSNPSVGSLHLRPSQTNFLYDLEEDILSRLPLKLLAQLKCACKSWNILISDPRFAKKHLRASLMRFDRHHLLLSSNDSSHGDKLCWDFPLPSVFNAVSATSGPQTVFRSPLIDDRSNVTVGSCDGIICFDVGNGFILLWNPSIRKFKVLSILENPHTDQYFTILSFGYDPFADDYKVVGVFVHVNGGDIDADTDTEEDDDDIEEDDSITYSEVVIYNLATNCSESIQKFPYGYPTGLYGIFLNGTVNWVATADYLLCYIVSLHLGNKSFQKISLPNYGGVEVNLSDLVVLRDCLGILCNTGNQGDFDVWIMNDYGREESWNKLFTLSFPGMDYARVIYMHEDDVLIQLESDIVIYNSKNGTFKTSSVILNKNGKMLPEIYVESFIWPCS